MGILRFSDFSGLIPKLAPRQLPDQNAQYAINAKLGSGELRGWGGPKLIATASTFARRVYHFVRDGVDHYVPFARRTEMVRALLINDAFDRIYYTDATGAYVTTEQRIVDGLPPFACGVPTPVVTGLQVTVTGGSENTSEVRVYSCTLVSNYGEESAPCVAAIGSGNVDGTWRVKGMSSLIFNDAAYPNVTKFRLYRTLTSASGVDYRMVREWKLDPTKKGLDPVTQRRWGLPNSYVDTVKSSVVAANFPMKSAGWMPPPAGLRGVVSCSGGFLAGFVGNTIRFSVPYQPHAWPDDYQLAVEDDIVGLGVFDSAVVAVTKGRPAVAIGYSPDSMALTNFPDPYPCLSVDGIVSTSVAVMFPSEQGLISIDPSGVNIVTEPLMTREEWAKYSPSTIRAAAKDTFYVGFYSDTMGFALDFTDPARAMTNLMLPGVTGLDIDRLTGRLLVLRNREILEWDGDLANPMETVWRSKPILLPKPYNFGAIQVRGGFGPTLNPRGAVDPDGYTVNTNDAGGDFPLGGDGESRLNSADVGYVRVRLIADNEVVFDGQINDELVHRLPSGFKATQYEVEIATSAQVMSVTLAGTPHELEQAT